MTLTAKPLPRLNQARPKACMMTLGSLTITDASGQFQELNEATACYDTTPMIYTVSYPKVKQRLLKSYHNKDIIGIIRQDKEIVGFIVAAIDDLQLFEKPVIYQTLYNSKLKGLKSVNALKLAHRFLIEHCKQRNLDYVISTGGIQDVKNQLSKILETDGWQRQGHTAIYTIRRE